MTATSILGCAGFTAGASCLVMGGAEGCKMLQGDKDKLSLRPGKVTNIHKIFGGADRDIRINTTKEMLRHEIDLIDPNGQVEPGTICFDGVVVSLEKNGRERQPIVTMPGHQVASLDSKHLLVSMKEEPANITLEFKDQEQKMAWHMALDEACNIGNHHQYIHDLRNEILENQTRIQDLRERKLTPKQEYREMMSEMPEKVKVAAEGWNQMGESKLHKELHAAQIKIHELMGLDTQEVSMRVHETAKRGKEGLMAGLKYTHTMLHRLQEQLPRGLHATMDQAELERKALEMETRLEKLEVVAQAKGTTAADDPKVGQLEQYTSTLKSKASDMESRVRQLEGGPIDPKILDKQDQLVETADKMMVRLDVLERQLNSGAGEVRELTVASPDSALLAKQLQDLTAQGDTLEQRVASLENMPLQDTQREAPAQPEISNANDEKLASLTQQLSSLKQKEASFIERIHVLENQPPQIQVQKEYVQQPPQIQVQKEYVQVQDEAALKAVRDESAALVKAARDESAALGAENEQLKRSYDELKHRSTDDMSHMIRMDEHEAQLEQHRARVGELEGLLDAEKMNAQAALETQAMQLTMEYQQKQAQPVTKQPDPEKEQAIQKVSLLTQKLSAVEQQASNTNRDHLQQIGSLQGALKETQDQLQAQIAATQGVAGAQQALQSTQQALQSSQQAQAQAQAAQAQAQEAARQAAQENAALQAEQQRLAGELEAERQRSAAQACDAQLQADKHEQQLAAMEAELQAKAAEAAKLVPSKRYEEIKERLDKAQAHIQQLENKPRSPEKLQGVSQETHQQLERELVRWQQSATQTQAENEQLAQQFSELQQENDALAQRLQTEADLVTQFEGQHQEQMQNLRSEHALQLQELALRAQEDQAKLQMNEVTTQELENQIAQLQQVQPLQPLAQPVSPGVSPGALMIEAQPADIRDSPPTSPVDNLYIRPVTTPYMASSPQTTSITEMPPTQTIIKAGKDLLTLSQEMPPTQTIIAEAPVEPTILTQPVVREYAVSPAIMPQAYNESPPTTSAKIETARTSYQAPSTLTTRQVGGSYADLGGPVIETRQYQPLKSTYLQPTSIPTTSTMSPLDRSRITMAPAEAPHASVVTTTGGARSDFNPYQAPTRSRELPTSSQTSPGYRQQAVSPLTGSLQTKATSPSLAKTSPNLRLGSQAVRTISSGEAKPKVTSPPTRSIPTTSAGSPKTTSFGYQGLGGMRGAPTASGIRRVAATGAANR